MKNILIAAACGFVAVVAVVLIFMFIAASADTFEWQWQWLYRMWLVSIAGAAGLICGSAVYGALLIVAKEQSK